MKNVLFMGIYLVILVACTAKDEAYTNEEASDLILEISSIDETLMSRIDFSSFRELTIEGVTFAVIDFYHNTTSSTPVQFLIKDQNGAWVEITNTKDAIRYRGLTNAVERTFPFYKHPTHGYSVVRLEHDVQMSDTKTTEQCPHCTRGYLIDVGLCTLTTTSMAIADGPLPFADYFAAAYFVGCENRAYRLLEDCVRHCLDKS